MPHEACPPAQEASAARVAILYPGDAVVRAAPDPAASRFAPLFAALAAAGLPAAPVVYHDDWAAAVEADLAEHHARGGLRLLLVWHNPIEGGRTRAILDALLTRLAERGLCISAHPDTIQRMGTKDVLVAVRDLPFGSEACRVESLDVLARELPARLAQGPRVLKQPRGHSGIGVWRIEALGAGRYGLRQAQRGAVEEQGDWALVADRLAPHFTHGGHMIDQAWLPRLAEGMVRAYLVQGRVAGFGHQAVNALVPAGPGEAAPPPPGPRQYSGADDPRVQALRQRLEGGWVQQLCDCLGVTPARLPLLWDADFLQAGPPGCTEDRPALCEINVSSVAPYPDAATAVLVAAVRQFVEA
jgi:hypothetical protein